MKFDMVQTNRIHYRTEIKWDIYSSPDVVSEAITEELLDIWPNTYFSDLKIDDYIPLVIDLWMKNYIQAPNTIEAVNKIKAASPPTDLKIYLVFNLLDNEDNLIIDTTEIRTNPLFRVFLKTKDLFDTYVYENGKFISLEIIEPAYIKEVEESLPQEQISTFDKLIADSFAFHNRLLELGTKKLLLYTSQPEERIRNWNSNGFIPIGTYFTDKMSRAEYYFNPEEHDIIVDYRIPENKVVMTNEFGGAKEYVTIEDIHLK